VRSYELYVTLLALRENVIPYQINAVSYPTFACVNENILVTIYINICILIVFSPTYSTHTNHYEVS